MRKARRRTGIQAVEVIVVMVVVGLTALVVLTALPRRREVMRSTTCRQNLMRIGVAMTLFEHTRGQLPGVPTNPSDGPSPFSAMLEALGQPDFVTLTDLAKPPKARPRPAGPAWRIGGLVCPSDPCATSGLFAAPVNYRATTGSTPGGLDGAFAPGRTFTLADIESADGLGYTAAFSERLLGNGADGVPDPRNFARVEGPVDDSACDGISPRSWRGDAGSSWATPGWSSTLYNHTLTPGETPSCVASDGRTARVGASSGHVEGVHVLLFDVSVRVYRPQVNLSVWRGLATVGTSLPALRQP
jgi:hypothetical protein